MRRSAILGEMARALSVLSLVLLAIAHQPAFGPTGGSGDFALAGPVDFICGQAVPGDSNGPHSSRQCAACRLAQGLSLPEPFCPAQAILFGRVAGADFAGSQIVRGEKRIGLPIGSRAPPVLI